MGCWRGYLCGAVRCRLAYGPADATSTHYLASVKSGFVFSFLVPAHLGSHGQRAVKRVHVCVVERTNILGRIYKLPDSHQHHKTLVSCILTVSNQFLNKNILSVIRSITYLELVKEEAELTCPPSAYSKQISDHSVYRRTGQSKGSPTSHDIPVSTVTSHTHFTSHMQGSHSFGRKNSSFPAQI